MTRRQFAFWIGMCLFWVAEHVRAHIIDELAAVIMRGSQPKTKAKSRQVRWEAEANQDWQWYERERLIDGNWTRSGVTTPVNRNTGERYQGKRGYLDESLVPADLRLADRSDPSQQGTNADLAVTEIKPGATQPDAVRQAREGRPPSEWLRSLNSSEICVWLKTIDVPPAEVSGMTFRTHLTRDHFFDPENIISLTVAEQAKLHAAAHFGY